MNTKHTQDDGLEAILDVVQAHIFIDDDGVERLGVVGYDTALQALKAREESIAVRERQSELDMFRKIPLQAMSNEVAAHVSRRYKALEDTLTQLQGEATEGR